MSQNIMIVSDNYSEIDEYIKANDIKKIFLVCDDSMKFMKIESFFDKLGDKVVRFSDFSPNPVYESVVKGVKLFLSENCDAIFAVGGGSAMDVAKCVKLYSNMDHSQNYLGQKIYPNDVKLLAVPTTAGTGSEATRYAVIYYEDVKQSITHDSIIPSTVVFDPSVLTTLPPYQKKTTLMDALCHAVESFWSVNSTDESKILSDKAIRLIMDNMEAYLAGDSGKNGIMLKAAHIAGEAINITQTTAAHAMCYKLTSLFGIAHGHAAALCLPALWEYMAGHTEKCVDSRGKEYSGEVFAQIAQSMGCSDVNSAITKFRDINATMGLKAPKMKNIRDFELLRNSVNPTRLKNSPITLSVEALDEIYHKIFEEQTK